MYFDPVTEVPRPVSLDDAYALAELPNWQKLVQPAIAKLVSLSHTCFPGYRPIVVEYCRIIGLPREKMLTIRRKLTGEE
jgi:hypothetical protein